MTTDETSNSVAAQPAARRFQAGEKLAGCYLLKEILPFDLPGVVWLVHDEELNKDLTLHFLPEAVFADSRAMSELKQETRRNRQIIHPHILRVHDLIEESDWAAISTDYIAGRTLKALQKEKGVFNASEVAGWISQICRTLEDAHRVDLLHRDLSPENVLVTKAGGIMVMNFGISRVILDSLARNGQPAAADANLAYLSPQQVDGERPSRWDDIYSLGAIAYELLSGQPPFAEPNLIAQIRKSVPAPISQRRGEIGVTGEAIPGSWDKVVAACLEKDPSQRPKNALEFAAQLGIEKAQPSAPAAAAVEAAPLMKLEPAIAVAGASEPGASAKPEDGRVEPPEVATTESGSQKAAVEAPQKPAGLKGEEMTDTRVSVDEKIVSPPSAPPEAEIDQAESIAKQQDSSKAAEKANTEHRPGITTPSGFPLKAFVEVDEAKASKQKRRFPIAAMSVAAAFIAFVAAAYFFGDRDQTAQLEESNAGFAPGVKYDQAQLQPAQGRSATSPDEPPPARSAAVAPPTPAMLAAASPAKASPTPAARAVSPSPTAPAFAAATASPRSQSAPAGTATAATAAVAVATAADAEPGSRAAQMLQLATEKAKAAEQARQALATADAAREKGIEARQKAEEAAKDAQQNLQQKTASLSASKKASDEAAAALKKSQEAQKRAEAEAEAAQKAAAEKARLVTEARKAAEAAAQTAKQASPQNIEAEIKELQRVAAERQRTASEAAKAVADLDATRQQQAQTLQKMEAEAAQARTAFEQLQAGEKQRLAEQRAARQQELAKRQAELQEQMQALQEAQEKARKALDDLNKSAESPQSAVPAFPVITTTPTANVTPSPVEMASKVAVAAVPAVPTPATTETKPTPPAARGTGPRSRIDTSLENSLGLKFAPVGSTLFSVSLTRVKDFEEFAKATDFNGTAWRQPGFKQGPDHPVVNVTWNEAMSFCKWLTEKEQKEGLLTKEQVYRLPTDLEWSKAVGLSEETGRTPEARDMDVPDQYPWGTQWPPPAGAGNYTGEETDSDVAIKGYNDGFAWTSPVGSFPPNKLGLYDMGGNVWQWCMDWWNNEQRAKVLRGGSWYNGALKLSLLSSCRIHAAPDNSTDNYGFRVVVASEAGKAKR